MVPHPYDGPINDFWRASSYLWRLREELHDVSHVLCKQSFCHSRHRSWHVHAQRALQAEARRSEENFQRLPALIAAALPVTDVTALQMLPEGGNALGLPRAAAQLAPADRTWLQTLLEKAVQQAADKVLSAQVLPAVPAKANPIASCITSQHHKVPVCICSHSHDECVGIWHDAMCDPASHSCMKALT